MTDKTTIVNLLPGQVLDIRTDRGMQVTYPVGKAKPKRILTRDLGTWVEPPVDPPPPTPITSIQAAIDAAVPGATVTIPPGTYRESVIVSKPLTMLGPGVIIDGRDTAGAVVRQTWMLINADDVTIDGFTMRYADDKPLPQWGALRIANLRNRVTIRNCDLGFATYAPLAIGAANAALIQNNNIHDGGALGIHVGGGIGGINNRIVGNRIYNNNVANGFDAEWEAGGVKATVQTGLVFDGNEVYGNHGPGLWSDIYNRGTQYTNNRIYDNTHAGIMEEVSYDGVISGNACWRNGFGKNVWGWGTGILVSSSTGTKVFNNTCAWNASANISIISQDRHDWPAVKPYKNISVHDNVVVALDHLSIAWLEDWAGPLFNPTSANGGAANRYWYSIPEQGHWRFAWAGYISYLAEFNATPAEEGGSYLTTAQRDVLLTAAGIPLAP